MKKLSEMPSGSRGRIKDIYGDKRFLSRITSIGITTSCEVEIMKNTKKQPMLIYSRDTLIAVNRKECENIILEEIS